MRTIVIILFSIPLFACAHNSNTEQFLFSDSHGKQYSSDTVGQMIKEEYELNENPKLILLATPNSESENFKSQIGIIKDIDPEKFQYLYVIANSNTVDESGYHTSKIDAKNILGDFAFKIIVFDQNGIPVESSNSVIDKELLLQYLAN